MRTGKPLSCESTIPADDPAWSKPSPILGQPQPIPPRNEPLLYISGVVQVAQEKQPVIHQKTRDTERGKHTRTGKPLSCESTIPADDPDWSKPSPILGQPQPIPPRNEPLLYISGAVQVAQEKQPVIHQKTRDTERGKHTRTGKPLSCESTIPADDSDWSKPSPIPGQPQPIPPRNERHYEPLLYISGVVQVAQETQPAIHHKTHDHDAERAGLRLTNRRMVCKRLKEPVNVKGHIYRSYCRFPAL